MGYPVFVEYYRVPDEQFFSRKIHSDMLFRQENMVNYGPSTGRLLLCVYYLNFFKSGEIKAAQNIILFFSYLIITGFVLWLSAIFLGVR